MIDKQLIDKQLIDKQLIDKHPPSPVGAFKPVNELEPDIASPRQRYEDRQDLLGHKSNRITTSYSAPGVARLVEAA